MRGFTITEALPRGFYGAAFRAKQQSLGRSRVLKIVPVQGDVVFGKNWTEECRVHGEVAEATDFVADIIDNFDENVMFGPDTLRCHVAVLEDIPGTTLEAILDQGEAATLTARSAAQIAADLFEILEVFTRHERYHNDLHARNIVIRTLDETQKRAGAFDPNIQAVAVDLGSVLDSSKSDATRAGDQHAVASHIDRLAGIVRRRRDSDVDFRIAQALKGLAEHLSPAGDAQRVMSAQDAAKALRASLQRIDAPWDLPLNLQTFSESYNAQVMDSWHVPDLWFDPDGRFLRKSAERGPQVITGMRGCGKTMLLRAVHFHARAREAKRQKESSIEEAIRRDSFLGVFASCQKLLNPQDSASPQGQIHCPFERLFVAYIRDAFDVLSHLRAIDPDALATTIDKLLRPAFAAMDLPHELIIREGEQAFIEDIVELQFGLADGSATCSLRASPTEAFAHLANVIRASSPMFANRYVLFLLDDVSTRYIPDAVVRDVISQLIFQHSNCAFRITTEAQALQRVMLSPGRTSPADPARDYGEFDLGNEVHRLLQTEKKGFVSEILKRRAAGFAGPLYKKEPRDVLGDVSLEQIAREIATSSESAAQRKHVYRGMRALRAVCVGDLGDVVKLYGRILQEAGTDELPVSAAKQSECFLAHSAGLLHFLNRRDQHNKSLALAFAQAAGELLPLLHKTENRLRQYTKLYVRIEPGPHKQEVMDKLFALLDAGVFVYDGGSPRSKTRDDDPVLQFKLSYRKLLGLASFIGLANRDRFELSGEKLRRWLFEPAEAKRLLQEGEARKTASEDEGDDTDLEQTDSSQASPGKPSADTDSTKQLGLFGKDPANATPSVSSVATSTFAPNLNIDIKQVSLDSWTDSNVDLLVLARGFEHRTAESTRRLLQTFRPKQIALVQYGGQQGRGVIQAIRDAGISPMSVDSLDDLSRVSTRFGSQCVVDVTGLSKPYLFCSVRDILAAFRSVRVVHTIAEKYYPTNEDLAGIGVTAESSITSETLTKLSALVLGEKGPYRLQRVHFQPAALERSRALIASSSPKNDRLLHLLDEREFEITHILVPPPTSPRRRVARAAAEMAATIADVNTELLTFETNNLNAAMEAVDASYRSLYFDLGMNVELGLTGPKVHAVACAALAAAARISFAWYVSPMEFDTKRFTTGVGETHAYEINWTEPPSDDWEPPTEIV